MNRKNERSSPSARLCASLLLVALALPGANAFAWGRIEEGHRGPVWQRHNPVVVHNVYVHHERGGCVGCGVGIAAVAGLVGGAIIGASIANSAPAPAPVYVEQAPPPQVIYAQQGMPIGTEVAGLPPGCANMNVNGTTFYQCGPTWYQPFMGGNGVYYTVVPAP